MDTEAGSTAMLLAALRRIFNYLQLGNLEEYASRLWQTNIWNSAPAAHST